MQMHRGGVGTVVCRVEARDRSVNGAAVNGTYRFAVATIAPDTAFFNVCGLPVLV
jgi:hypothetical protein